MIKIIKYGCEYNIPKKSLATINPAYDGIRIILNDRTEISFQMNVSNQIKALIPIITTSTADVITLNLDAAISGQYDKVLDMSNNVIEPIKPQVVIFDNSKIEKNEQEKPTKPTTKKAGRPSKKS